MNLSKIFEAFPPPKFLALPCAGISITDTAVRCIQFDKKGGKLAIDKYYEKSLAPGVITSGQINNKDELINVLTEIKQKLKLDYVKVSLPEEKGYLFTSKLPIVKR